MRALHTPQQETNSAYNPGVTFQGGQFLAQGISQAGDAITEGLQRYAANKQESAALDMRFEGTAKPLMEKLKLYGQLAVENSPAAALLDKSADWHKLGNNQKKVLLADMLLLGDKTEAEQRRKEAEQYKLLEIQDRQAQFDELQKHHAFQRGQAATDTLFRGLSAYQDNRRLGLSERSTALAEQTHADTLAQRAAALREKQAVDKDVAGFWNYVAPRVTAPAGMGPTLSLDMAAIEGMSQFPRTRQDPNLDNLVGALGRMQPKPAWSPSVQVVDGVRFGTTSPSSAQVLPGAPPPTAPLPIVPGFTPVPTGEPGRVQWLKTAAPNGTEPDRETLGRIAQLEELLRQKGGQDFAFDYNNTAGYSTSRFWDDGKSAKAELARLRGMTGGVPASGPASGGSRFKVEEIK